MTDTRWPDISSYQPNLPKIPYPAAAIRSNDGTYRDPHFALNLAQCKHAVTVGDFDFFLIYLVFEPNWQDTLATFKSMVGAPHPKMAVMIDVESWGGKITGNHSSQINALAAGLVSYLGGNAKRVGWYANGYDHDTLAPGVNLPWFVLANYSGNPATPAHFAHQYTDAYYVPGLGMVDMNSADGKTVQDCITILGLDDNMPLTTTDIEAVAEKVWNVDAVPMDPTPNSQNPNWLPGSVFQNIRAHVLNAEVNAANALAAVNALTTKVTAADDSKDVAALAAQVASLKTSVATLQTSLDNLTAKVTTGGVDPVALAAAITAHIQLATK